MFCVNYFKNHGFVMYTLTLTVILHNVITTSGETYINQFAVHVKGGKDGLERVLRSTGLVNKGQIGDIEDHYFLEIPNRQRRSDSHSHEHHSVLSSHQDVHWFEQQIHKPRYKRDVIPNPYADQLNDKLYIDQWYLHGGGRGNFDMNVIPAWKKGYTGKNVVISILDDGIERNHPDLEQNYDPYASYDVNDHDNDPMPRYDHTNENRHGTRCAGEVSAVANNTLCGVGVAPNSRIGGVRMLDGEVYDAVEAASLSFNRSHIDIYSASWGPDDDGRVVDGPGPLAKKAFIDGITRGRQGKGSIYVWASGNGGRAHDSCNCDGYTNSIYTLSISSTSQKGTVPWYLEECSSTLATTYSSGAYNEKQIVTVDLHGSCTETHTGTSASAPLAAGVVALVLEANPSLTWRDVQYITLLTANPAPMVDGLWMTNSLGRKVSLRYGYGLMDTAAMVDLAEVWTNVPEQHICEVFSNSNNVKLDGSTYVAHIETQACGGMNNDVKFLEHVQVKISLMHKRRGDVIITIASPRGTVSKLLPKRPNDRQEGEFKSWPFLSVHFWGEDPSGIWTLQIDDAKSYNPQGATGGILRSWSIVFHGTATIPVHLSNHTAPVTPSVPEVVTSQPTTKTQSTISPVPYTCHEQCKDVCTGPKADDCKACKHFQIATTGICAPVCPEGFYPINQLCQPCDSTCKTCTGPTLSECLTCHTNRFFTEKHHICVDKCLKGYYEDKHVTQSPKNTTTHRNATTHWNATTHHNATTHWNATTYHNATFHRNATTHRNISGSSLNPISPLERHDVECTRRSMKLFIPLKYVGESTRYALRDPKCFLSANRSHLVGEFNLNECGTQIRFEKDAIIFSNVLSHVSDPHQSVISVECEYPRRQNLSTGYEFPSHSKVDIYEKGKGVGIIDIRRYTTNRYTDKITSENSDPPRPGDDIYVELAVDQKSPNSLGVVADLCVASPTPYPAGREVITLIENNCKQEKHPVTIYDTIKELMRFSFPAPDFEGTGRVYVHCQVSVCSKTTDCDPNCSTRRSKRSARPSFLITSGPIVLNTSSDMFLTSSNIAIGCLSLLSLVLLTAVFVLIKQRLPKQIL